VNFNEFLTKIIWQNQKKVVTLQCSKKIKPVSKKPYNFTDDAEPLMACEPALAYKTTSHSDTVAGALMSDKRNSNDLSYSFLQAEKKRQMQMIATGKMEKPELKDDVFTLEQETDFSRKITIDDIFQNR